MRKRTILSGILAMVLTGGCAGQKDSWIMSVQKPIEVPVQPEIKQDSMPEPIAKDVEWRDLGSGLMEAETKGLPLLVFFYAKWCVPCRQMDKVTWSNSMVAGFVNRHFVPVRQDIEDSELADKIGIDSTPRILIVDHDGSRGIMLKGYAGPEKLMLGLPVVLEIREGMPRGVRVEVPTDA